ncbi:MAG: PIN domain-containing protein [Bacteroidales bacterium]|nr:PIN domain-containing protein [Bacteroidales bacterium]
MKIKVYLDTNVLIDVLAGNRKYSLSSQRVFEAIRQGYIEAFLSTQSIIDASYAMRRDYDKDAFCRMVEWSRNHINISYIDSFNLGEALRFNSGDYEDDAQYACALANYCDVLITGDKKLKEHHANTNPHLIICTPDEFVARLQSA